VRTRRGVGLLHLLMASALFGLLMVSMGFTLTWSARVLNHSSGRDTAIRQLTKARTALLRDIQCSRADAASMAAGRVPAHLPAGGWDGDSLSFVSPRVGNTGETAYAPDGTVFWMRTVTYFVMVCRERGRLFGCHCEGRRNPDGYDHGCPHKLLLRREVDHPPATLPGGTLETLAPQGTLPQPDSAPNLPELQTMATELLSFRAWPSSAKVEVEISAVSLDDAQRTAGFGATGLRDSAYTLTQRFVIYPRN
jgi:hypothetical protein